MSGFKVSRTQARILHKKLCRFHRPKMAPRRPSPTKSPSRPLKMAPRWLQDDSKSPKSFSRPPKMAPRWLQDAPRGPPRPPKMAPRRPQAVQDDPKIIPRGTPEVPRGSHQGIPRGPHQASKIDPKIDPKSSRIRDSQSGSNIAPADVPETSAPHRESN